MRTVGSAFSFNVSEAEVCCMNTWHIPAFQCRTAQRQSSSSFVMRWKPRGRHRKVTRCCTISIRRQDTEMLSFLILCSHSIFPIFVYKDLLIMIVELTEEQRMIRDAARDFAQQELKPGVIERDENQIFPSEQIKKLGDLGFLGMMVHPKYNGAGLDAVSYVLVMEELSKVDASASVVVSVNNSLVCYGLEKYGSEEQKEKYLKPLAEGKIIGAFCLSEPEAGSDATSQHTTAEDRGDHYLLNGTKNWITNGSTASVYLVFAQTHPEKGSRGINVFIVEKD